MILSFLVSKSRITEGFRRDSLAKYEQVRDDDGAGGAVMMIDDDDGDGCFFLVKKLIYNQAKLYLFNSMNALNLGNGGH